MQLQQNPYSLDRLEDIVQPEPVSWWPPAPCWYYLIAIVAVWTLYWLTRTGCRWLQNGYRRQALHELTHLSVRSAQSVSTILKRVALVSYANEKVAALTGDDWLRFLNDSCDGVDFLRQPASSIGQASFDPHISLSEGEYRQIVMNAKTWIVSHRAERSP